MSDPLTDLSALLERAAIDTEARVREQIVSDIEAERARLLDEGTLTHRAAAGMRIAVKVARGAP